MPLGGFLKRPQQMTQQAQAQRAAAQQAMQQQYMQALAKQNNQATSLYTSTSSSTAGLTWVSVPLGTSATTVATTTPTSLGNNVMNTLYNTQHLAQGTSALVRDTLRLMGEVTIADGEPCKITLPDGSVLEVAADGSFTINDKDAKVTYRANRVRDFNSYINASDKLEAFIKYCGEQGVKQDEMLDIPVKLFIGWLILQAAMADGENPEPDNLLEDLRDRVRPRCRCGRFISRKLTARKIAFCRPVCLERELEAA